MSDLEQLKEEYRRIQAQRTHLGLFAEAALGIKPVKHHQLICDTVDDLLADKFDELIINVPPGSGKSHYISKALPAYFLGRFPKAHILTCSYSTELSEKWGRSVRNMLGEPAYNRIFPDTALSVDSKAAGRWATASGGEFYAAGVGGGILGFRADCGIIDDPISGFEEAQSMTRLSNLHQWFEVDFTTRLKPRAKTILICQRLARNDLAGYMIDRNLKNPTRRQRVIKIPMLCTDPATDLLGRPLDGRLWPEWFTDEMVKDAQRDSFKWKTLYQQEPPADEGSWVSTEDFRHAPTPAIDHSIYTYYGLTDLALSVNTGDFTVHIVVAYNKTSGFAHIVDASRERVDPNDSSKKLISLQKTYRTVEWLIDDDNASKVFAQLVATEARATATPINWKPMPMRGQNKETRAASLRGMFKRNLIYMDPKHPLTPVIQHECLQFPNALGQGVDDTVDTLSLFGRRLASLQAVTTVQPVAKQPTTQDMTLDGLWDSQPRQSTRV